MKIVSIRKTETLDEVLLAKAWLTFLDNKSLDVQLDKNLSKKYFELGTQCQASGNFAGAANNYCQSIIANSENVHSYKYLSLVLSIIGVELNKAIEFIEYIRSKNLFHKDYLEAVSIEIYIKFRNGSFEKIEPILMKENISTNVENFDLIEILCIACSMSYLYLGEYDKSYDWGKRLQKYNAENGIPYLIFGTVLLSRNSIEEAIYNYEKALEFSEKAFGYLYMNNTDKEICCADLTFAYAQIKDFEKSEFYCFKSLKINNRNPLPYLNLSSLYARNGKDEKMREYLEKGLDLVDRRNPVHDKMMTAILLDDCFIDESRTILLDNLLIRKLIPPVLYYYAKRISFKQENKKQINILEIVKQGNIRDALDELLLRSRYNNSINNDLIHLLGSYSFLENQQRLGLINFQDFLQERGKIQYALITIIDSIDKQKR